MVRTVYLLTVKASWKSILHSAPQYAAPGATTNQILAPRKSPGKPKRVPRLAFSVRVSVRVSLSNKSSKIFVSGVVCRTFC